MESGGAKGTRGDRSGGVSGGAKSTMRKRSGEQSGGGRAEIAGRNTASKESGGEVRASVTRW